MPRARRGPQLARRDDQGDQRGTDSGCVSGTARLDRRRPRRPDSVRSSGERTREGQGKGEAQTRGKRLTETLAGGRYRLDRTLGHGGMAVAYLPAEEKLPPPGAGQTPARKRFGPPGLPACLLR